MIVGAANTLHKMAVTYNYEVAPGSPLGILSVLRREGINNLEVLKKLFDVLETVEYEHMSTSFDKFTLASWVCNNAKGPGEFRTALRQFMLDMKLPLDFIMSRFVFTTQDFATYNAGFVAGAILSMSYDVVKGLFDLGEIVAGPALKTVEDLNVSQRTSDMTDDLLKQVFSVMNPGRFGAIYQVPCAVTDFLKKAFQLFIDVISSPFKMTGAYLTAIADLVTAFLKAIGGEVLEGFSNTLAKIKRLASAYHQHVSDKCDEMLFQGKFFEGGIIMGREIGNLAQIIAGGVLFAWKKFGIGKLIRETASQANALARIGLASMLMHFTPIMAADLAAITAISTTSLEMAAKLGDDLVDVARAMESGAMFVQVTPDLAVAKGEMVIDYLQQGKRLSVPNIPATKNPADVYFVVIRDGRRQISRNRKRKPRKPSELPAGPPQPEVLVTTEEVGKSTITAAEAELFLKKWGNLIKDEYWVTLTRKYQGSPFSSIFKAIALDAELAVDAADYLSTEGRYKIMKKWVDAAMDKFESKVIAGKNMIAINGVIKQVNSANVYSLANMYANLRLMELLKPLKTRLFIIIDERLEVALASALKTSGHCLIDAKTTLAELLEMTPRQIMNKFFPHLKASETFEYMLAAIKKTDPNLFKRYAAAIERYSIEGLAMDAQTAAKLELENVCDEIVGFIEKKNLSFGAKDEKKVLNLVFGKINFDEPIRKLRPDILFLDLFQGQALFDMIHISPGRQLSRSHAVGTVFYGLIFEVVFGRIPKDINQVADIPFTFKRLRLDRPRPDALLDFVNEQQSLLRGSGGSK